MRCGDGVAAAGCAMTVQLAALRVRLAVLRLRLRWAATAAAIGQAVTVAATATHDAAACVPKLTAPAGSHEHSDNVRLE